MLLPLTQTVSAKSAIMTRLKRTTPANTVLAASALAGMLSLSACQTVPTITTAKQTTPIQTIPSSQMPDASTPTVTQAPIIRADDEDNYSIEPYNPAESTNPSTQEIQETPIFTPSNPTSMPPNPVIITPSRDDYITPEPSIPSHNELLEQARKNSQQRTQQSASNNSNLPAFRNLMQVGVSQLKSGNLTNAENTFTRAQRLAPKSSAVYFYLAQVALKKNQPRKAEAMARRGLSVSQDTNRRRALWQVILQSGQAQGNARVINEAKQALR
ncbi:tetratricopeptide repeat protein [Psychrobacter aquaticus]|nr:tetratricopeptide repeat protein [Psychrobacter aquaticus]